MLSKKLNHSEFEEQAVVGTISNWPQTELASVEFDEASWSTKRDLTIPGIYEAVVEQQTPVLCGFQETNNVSDHFNTGVTYTRYLGIKTSATDYETFLAACVPSQKEWITWLHKDMEGQVIAVVHFANEMAGGVLGAAYDYLCDHLPMAIKEDQVPRLLMSSGDSMWLGSTMSSSTCDHIRSQVATGPQVESLVSETEKEIIRDEYRRLYQPIKLEGTFNPKIDAVLGLINKKNPIKKPEDKKKVNTSVWHGARSKNWEENNLLLTELCDSLLNGFHHSLGLTILDFDDKGQQLSRRKKEAFIGTHALFLDVDEWKQWDREPPKDIEDFRKNYIPKGFPKPAFIMESPNSNTEKYPYPRYRAIYITPSMLNAQQTEIIGQHLMDHIPGCPKDVGFNIMRCGYGNARPECESYTNFDNVLSNEFLNLVLNDHRNRKIDVEAAKEIKNLEISREASRDSQDIVQTHSKRSYEQFNKDFYNEIDFKKWIAQQGHVYLQTTADGWMQYKRAGKEDEGISFAVMPTTEGFIVVVFSTSMDAPAYNEGISGFRFYTYVEDGIDIKNAPTEKNREVFAQYGYEPTPEEEPDLDFWREHQEEETFPNRVIFKKNYYTECVPELKDLEEKYDIIILKAVPDSGKTTLQAELADPTDPRSIKLIITPRKSLCNNSAESIENYVLAKMSPEAVELYQGGISDFIHGDVEKDKEWTAPSYTVSTTINSLERVDKLLKAVEIKNRHLTFDEIDYIISALLDNALKDKAWELLQKIKRMIQFGGATYIMGATATNNSIKRFLRIMQIDETEVVECLLEKPEQKPMPDFQYIYVPNSKQIVEIVAQQIDKYHANKKVFIACATKEVAKSLAEHELIKKRGECGLITSETSQTEKVKEWLACRTLEDMGLETLICSPSIDVGVDLRGPETQIITIRTSTNGGSIATTFQQARRIRDSKYPIEHYTVGSKKTGPPELTQEEYIRLEKDMAKMEWIYHVYGCPEGINSVHYKIDAEYNEQMINDLKEISFDDLLDNGYIEERHFEYYRTKNILAELQGYEKWKKRAMNLNEKSFLKYHCEEEGRKFVERKLYREDMPSKQQFTAGIKRDAARRKEEQDRINEKVVEIIKNREVLSINEIEELRQNGGFEDHTEYKAANAANRLVREFGFGNKTIEKNRDQLPDRAWKVIDQETEKRYVSKEDDKKEKNPIALPLLIKKKRIHEFSKDPTRIRENEEKRIKKVLVPGPITELQYQILKALETEYTEAGRIDKDQIDELSLKIAKKEIPLLNNADGSVSCYSIFQAAIRQFSDDSILKRYKANKEKNGPGNAVYQLFRKLMRDYLSLTFKASGAKNKYRTLVPEDYKAQLEADFDEVLEIYKLTSNLDQLDLQEPEEQPEEQLPDNVIPINTEQALKELGTYEEWKARQEQFEEEERLAIMEG